TIPTRHLTLDFAADTPQRDTHSIENTGGDTVVFAHETQKQMLGGDIVLSQASGFFLREEHHPSRPLCKSLPHGLSSSLCPSWQPLDALQRNHGGIPGEQIVPFPRKSLFSGPIRILHCHS